MEPDTKPQDLQGLYQALKTFKPGKFAEITRDYGLDHSQPPDREELVREFVPKQTQILRERDPVWRRMRDIILRALARVSALPPRWRGNAFDAGTP